MKYGLNEKVIEKINSVFSKHPQIKKVMLYGSRAKGNYRGGSDIDLCIVGDDIELSLVHKIELELDDLLLPYTVDLSVYSDINSDELIDHIDRMNEIFYKKDSQ